MEMKIAQAALAVRLLTMAAMISVGKSQPEDEEESEESMSEFNVMMAVFTVVVIMLTLLAQAVWKVGVSMYEQRIKEASERSSRSLPAQSDSESGPRAQKGERGSGSEERSSSSDQPPPEIQNAARG